MEKKLVLDFLVFHEVMTVPYIIQLTRSPFYSHLKIPLIIFVPFFCMNWGGFFPPQFQ